MNSYTGKNNFRFDRGVGGETPMRCRAMIPEGRNVPLTFAVLTYMSIRDEISARVSETPPRLFLLPPLIPSVSMVREMFVSEEINRVAHPPWPPTSEGRRQAQMRAYLDAWSEGR